MRLLASLFVCLCLSVGLSLSAPAAHAETLPEGDVGTEPTAIVPVPEAENAATEPQPLSMPEAIKKGRAMLHELVKKPYAVPNRNTANIHVAVWDRDDDSITVGEYRKYGDELTFLGGTKQPIRVSVNAKANSVYVTPPADNSLVVGVIYPNFVNAGTAKNPKWMAHESVLTPYQQAFYTPEMLVAGSNYLSFLIQDAYDELDAKGIKSRAFPDKLVTEIVDPYLVKSIAIIEHSGVYDLTKPDDQDRAIGRFLVKLAMNGEGAFGNAISTAGAAGMVQFIPSTYQLMVNKRPDLGLIPDFRAGMANHQNAVKAQVAYIDMDLASMPMAKAAYMTDKSKAAEFLAASYNGGQTRVKKAFAAYGTNWAESATSLRALAVELNGKKAAPLSVIQASSLRNETVGYVAKLKHAYGMLQAGYYATPQAPSGALPVQQVAATPEAAPSSTSTKIAIASTVGMICFGDGSCVQ